MLYGNVIVLVIPSTEPQTVAILCNVRRGFCLHSMTQKLSMPKIFLANYHALANWANLLVIKITILFPIPDDSLANKHWLFTVLWDHCSEDGQSVVHIQQSYNTK